MFFFQPPFQAENRKKTIEKVKIFVVLSNIIFLFQATIKFWFKGLGTKIQMMTDNQIFVCAHFNAIKYILTLCIIEFLKIDMERELLAVFRMLCTERKLSR